MVSAPGWLAWHGQLSAIICTQRWWVYGAEVPAFAFSTRGAGTGGAGRGAGAGGAVGAARAA